MKEWLDVDRTMFLHELLRLDGRSQYLNRFCACAESMTAEYRCTDCILSHLVCQRCILMSHGGIPLHRVEVRVYLNYPAGEALTHWIEVEWLIF